MLSLISTDVVAVQVAEGDIVAAGEAGQERRAIMVITNTDTAARILTLHKYDSGGAAAQTNAVVAYNRSMNPNEIINYDTWLLGIQKLTGLADVADKITVDTVIIRKT